MLEARKTEEKMVVRGSWGHLGLALAGRFTEE
jgi:hypothetical protein